MIQEILDMCELYPLARSLAWYKNYTEEEQKGIALLQRIQRLDSDRAEALNPKKGSTGSVDIAPDLYMIDEQLQRARQIYCTSREKLRKMWLNKPKGGALFRDMDMARKLEYTEHDRP